MRGADVADRVIIVTGGGGGIGRGLVRHLTGAGARVVVGERDAEKLRAVAAELAAAGAVHRAVLCDVGDRASIDALVRQTHETFGRIDALVNNAMSFPPHQPLAELSEENLEVALVTGVKGTLWGMQAVYPHMRQAGWGRIVNVGSAAGIIGFKGFGAYSAAKEAVRALTRTAAREWASDGIAVNLYCPVSYHHASMPDDYTAQAVAVERVLSPSGYIGDAVADVGPVVAFLCSESCRYLTGQTLTLDGGTYAFA